MLETGTVIDGKYKILNVIGRGGMSRVYLAMNERVNRQWAVKEIRKQDACHLHANKKEIEMLKRLSHPHLPGIVDVIENRDTLLIVMDYIEGRSLQDLLNEYGAQPQEQVLSWAGQLCDTLSYLHSRKPAIIYRDMKPSNVMLKPDGNVMLIDFGAAREYKPTNTNDTVSLGTRGYAAPEQYEKEGQSDARTDIYCLGVMLFQLLTGGESSFPPAAVQRQPFLFLRFGNHSSKMHPHQKGGPLSVLRGASVRAGTLLGMGRFLPQPAEEEAGRFPDGGGRDARSRHGFLRVRMEGSRYPES